VAQRGLLTERGAYALMLLAPAMFCSNMLVARASVGLIPPVALAFWRWFATLLLVGAIFGHSLWRVRSTLWRERFELLAMGALGMGVCGAFVYIGAATTSATNIGIIYAATPVLIIALGRLVYDEPMSAVRAAGVGLSLLGVLVVITRGDPEVLLGLRFTQGDLWVLVSMIAWAVYSVLLRHRPSGLALNERFGGIVLGGVVALLPFALAEAATVGPAPLNGRVLATALFLAAVASFGAYQVYALIQRAIGASRAGLIFYLTPLYNALLAYAFLGERLAAFHIAGAMLVLPGIYLATRR
jgi:drug/metabolite transporter (DMT)-like permease